MGFLILFYSSLICFTIGYSPIVSPYILSQILYLLFFIS